MSDESEETSLDFGEAEIAPGDVHAFQVQPGRTFAPRRLAFEESHPMATSALALFVGQRLQKPLLRGAVHGTPSCFFNGISAGFNFDECPADQAVTLWVQNRHAEPVKVTAKVAGRFAD